ncbi:MAG TPA: hypothetical protein VFK07_02750, partial [Candidatus Paceibacterota bacterium]|nr:hypothetical protein [Candidatus Paceibacterota bacterium]
MPPSKKSGALFDVKPVDDSGSVDFSKTENIDPVVNLSSYRPKKQPNKKGPLFRVSKTPSVPASAKPRPVLSDGNVKDDFENFLNNEINLDIELAKIGATPLASKAAKPRYKIIRSSKPENVPETSAPETMAPESAPETPVQPEPEPTVPGLDMDAIISEIQHSAHKSSDNNPMSEPSPKEDKVDDFMAAKPVVYTRPLQNFKPAKKVFRFPKLGRKKTLLLLLVIIGGSALAWSGLRLKNSVVAESSAAVSNLQNAHADLAMLNFSSASEDFAQAYGNFSKAGDNLNFMGSVLTSIIGSMPGGGSVKSASNLLKAGKLLANAGSAMTDALDAVSKAGVLLDPTGSQVAIGNVVGALQEALSISKTDIVQAKSLLADVDASIIPPDQQANFNDFKTKLPELE